MGFKWVDWIFPINPKLSHNYLERVYTVEQLTNGKHKFEVEDIRTSRLYLNYFIDESV